MKRILVITIGVFLIFGCGNSEKEQTDNTANNEAKSITEKPKDEKLEQLKIEAARLRGGGSIKIVELIEDQAKITYVKDFSEYKEINPQSSVSKELLESYWESGDAIEKALTDGSVRLMKKLDYINGVSIILPYKGKTYSISVGKKELEGFIGSDFSTIKDNWNLKFSDPYVYEDSGRQKFFKKFGKIE